MKRSFKFVLFLIFLAASFLASPLLLIEAQKNRIYSSLEEVEPTPVALVFGAGLNKDGRPSDALMDRLISAAELYFADKVDMLLLSGSNTELYYNEPAAMTNFLIEWGVPEADIIQDFAGDRTYDSCARAKELWGLTEAILVTQDFHLPRALFLCNGMGITSYGYSASRQPYVLEEYYLERERLAQYKAILDLYFLKPDYVKNENESL